MEQQFTLPISLLLSILLMVSVAFSMPDTLQLSLKDVVSCPCSNPKWCDPITDKERKEQFVFSTKNDENHWKSYDWSKLTTIATADYFNMSLVCLAHSHNTRVIYMAQIDEQTFMSPQLRKAWIEAQMTTIRENRLDGINFDYEDVIGKGEVAKRDSYTAVVRETRSRLLQEFPHAVVAVDVGWRPNVDVRYYDYPALAQNSDFLVLMAYDEQSMIYGECLAGPNCPLNPTLRGVQEFLNHYDGRITVSQLILAVPWFGMSYKCLETKQEKCYIEKVPWRGAPCSDSPGQAYDYKDIEKLHQQLPDSYKWNSSSSTPYILYTNKTTGITYQVQYDDLRSLKLKYDLALDMDLRGVGIFTIDMLDYSDTPQGMKMREAMFGALPPTKPDSSSITENVLKYSQRPPCPCKDQKLCEPIKDTTRREVVGFSANNDESHWQLFDWSKLTTVIMAGYVNPKFVCIAHAHGARIIVSGAMAKKDIYSPKLRTKWIQKQFETVYNNYLDGYNFDFEDPCKPGQKKLRNSYTALVQEARKKFKNHMPHSQISVDVIDSAFSTYRAYDYQALAAASDFLFIMAYDESTNGNVGPNSNYWTADWAIKTYQRDKIHPNKIVLGLPWYGDLYQCSRMEGDTCKLGEDSVGGSVEQVCYCGIMETLNTVPDHYRWNASSKTPYFSYKNGHNYQVQYDDPRSLWLKYKLAVHAGIRGVGIWHLDCIDYSRTDYADKQRKKMFAQLPKYKSLANKVGSRPLSFVSESKTEISSSDYKASPSSKHVPRHLKVV